MRRILAVLLAFAVGLVLPAIHAVAVGAPLPTTAAIYGYDATATGFSPITSHAVAVASATTPTDEQVLRATGDLSSRSIVLVAVDSEVSAASKALSQLPKAARTSEKPPGFNPETWQWRAGSRNNVGMDWWDPEGGEWRYHPADKYHDPHFDYNPWTQWNTPWQHLYPGN